MNYLPAYPNLTVGAENAIPSGSEVRKAQLHSAMQAAQVAFFGAVGAVVGAIVVPQLAGEYFEWMGGAIVGALLFGGITAAIQ